jgi:hypothetical protein
MSEASLLAEKRRLVFEDQDEEEKREAERRKEEWEEVESSALGMGRMPEGKKRSIGGSTVGGVSHTNSLATHMRASAKTMVSRVRLC